MHFRKILSLCVFFLSGVAFFYACFRPDVLWTAVCSLPFFVFLCAVIHEGGHAFACLALGRRIHCVRLPFWQLRHGKLTVYPGLRSCIGFAGRGHDLPIYLAGPAASVLLGMGMLNWFLICADPAPRLYGVAAWLTVAVALFPAGSSDGAKILQEMRK